MPTWPLAGSSPDSIQGTPRQCGGPDRTRGNHVDQPSTRPRPPVAPRRAARRASGSFWAAAHSATSSCRTARCQASTPWRGSTERAGRRRRRRVARRRLRREITFYSAYRHRAVQMVTLIPAHVRSTRGLGVVLGAARRRRHRARPRPPAQPGDDGRGNRQLRGRHRRRRRHLLARARRRRRPGRHDRPRGAAAAGRGRPGHRPDRRQSASRWAATAPCCSPSGSLASQPGTGRGTAARRPQPAAVAALSPAIFGSYRRRGRRNQTSFDSPADFARNDVIAMRQCCVASRAGSAAVTTTRSSRRLPPARPASCQQRPPGTGRHPGGLSRRRVLGAEPAGRAALPRRAPGPSRTERAQKPKRDAKSVPHRRFLAPSLVR